jgi:2-polyprenyl-3-methyl-5-hydroxy-6-metoxy-1,4-benzoquinol methylase
MTMTPLKSDFLEKMRQQFDNAPYPRIPLEKFPENPKSLYIHSLVTAYYRRNQKVVTPAGKLILDAGCGTGYKSLELAIANPGARIVGIDLSPASIDLARKRLQYHNIENAEFHAIALEDLPSLGMQFDYINNDEVLYLLPDPIAGLKAMKEVLKPDGILRTNFHSSLQRALYLGAQEFFNHVGLMGGDPEENVELVRQTMRCLKEHVLLKARGWGRGCETDSQVVLANYLLEGDKGWTIPEFFVALREANLEFISMVSWRDWDLLNLFTNTDEMPISIMLSLSEKTLEEQLHFVELLHPNNRLLDAWCGHEGRSQSYLPISEWTNEQWQTATVHINPLLHTDEFKQDLTTCVTQLKAFQISSYLQLMNAPVAVDSLSAGCLLPLLEMPQSMGALVQWWQKLRPFNPVTLEPTPDADALDLIKNLLLPLEDMGYVMVECPD